MKTPLTITFCFACALCNAQQTTLRDALMQASRNRPSVKAARLQIEQARHASKALGAYAPTTLGLGASSRGEVGATDGDLFVSQAIDVFGRNAANRRLGGVGIESAKVAYSAQLLDLQTDVMDAYFEASNAYRLSQSAHDLLEIAEKLQKATIRRFEEGKVAEVQVTRSQIEYGRAKQAALLRESQLKTALKRLSGLVGVEIVQLDSEAAIEPLKNKDTSLRPDLLAIKAEIEAAKAEAGIASRSSLPEVEFQIRRSPWNDTPSYWGGRLQLTWSIDDHGKSRNETQAAKRKAEASMATFEDAKARSLSELAANDIEIAAAESSVKSLSELTATTKLLVEKAQKGFSQGVSTLIDVLEATRALREVEQELSEARLSLNVALVSQYRLTGTLMEVVK
ncbi:MAG: TolC family protein [Nitrospira sp.]|nr:TolC family protein [Nitrospira sp.]